MLKQIQAKLEVKYPGLSKVFLGLIAAQMATKVTEESGIDAAIAELDNAPIPITTLASEFQREGDRRVTDAEKAFKIKYKITDTPPAPVPVDPPKPGDPVETETDKLLKQLLQKVDALESGKTQESNTTRLITLLKEKKVPEAYYQVAIAGRTFKDSAEVDAFAGTLTDAYGKYHQEQVNLGLKEQPAPVLGVIMDPANEVSPAMKSHLAKQKAEREKQQTQKPA